MKIETKYSIGDAVYIHHDPEQYLRMVTAITIKPGGHLYELSLGTQTTDHYDIELSREININVM